ncbi:anti-CBASS protein Acb1 family protein [Brucella anthropi]|uniref:phage portal protein n=1 Tax=Brucella anthropi TaxID=529 RepID=UPI000289579C|nr:anti-CBASS Acb1 family protein [Brucella anthropi]
MTNSKPRVRVNTAGVITDGFANLVAGLGAGNAKTSAHTYVIDHDQMTLENAYRVSTWFGKIVDIPADDATREWRTWKADKEDIERIEAEEKRLQVRQQVRQALIWARLYGGAVIIPLGLPGALNQPLSIDRIAKGSIKALTVLSRHEITALDIITDPLDPLYGSPAKYVINSANGQQVELHPSRVIRVNGRTVNNRRVGANGWGDSIWMHISDAVMAADSAASVIDALLQEAKIDVVRIKNMMTMMANADMEATMIKRWQMVAVLKSISNVLMLDGDDEWDQKQITWTGLPDVTNTLLNVMAGAADIPLTRLTGKQEAGLSGKDEGSLRNYYDSVKAKQELIISPILAPLDAMLIRSALGKSDDGIWASWVPLFQLSEKEKADIDKIEAETVDIYARTGLVPTDALAEATQNRMIESGRWPGLDEALEESDEDVDGTVNPDELEAGEAVEVPKNQQTAADASPKTLYVRRDVLNADEIIAWAKGQGFKTTLPTDNMHVTIAFSRTSVDWMKVGQPWSDKIEIAAGGPRMMEAFGDAGQAKVLLFASSELSWRHQEIRNAGASWDHDEYQPHITISYAEDAPALDTIEPYRGKIVLGPEIFEQINEKWMEGITEDNSLS